MSKVERHIRVLDSYMRCLELLRTNYDPIFEDRLPYAIVASLVGGKVPGDKLMAEFDQLITLLGDAISTFGLSSGMLVANRELMMAIRRLARGDYEEPEEVFQWWTNQSPRSLPSETDALLPSS